MENLVELIGMIAAVLTTLSFLPQVIKTYKDKSAESLSMIMLVAFITGVCLWLVYGLLIHSMPLIASNIVTAILGGTLIYFKVTYGKKSLI